MNGSKMNKFIKYAFVFFLFFSGCSKVEIIDTAEYSEESEPNGQSFSANEISAGKVYRAYISLAVNDSGDEDIFKFWSPAGTLISFEIESDENNFQPYIGHTDNLSHAQFVIFNPPGKFRADFITSVDGWQYFEIGDIRNTAEEGERVGGFSYYFRMISQHICSFDDNEKISSDEKIERSFPNGRSGVDILEMDIEENGIYQLKVETEEMFSDKFTFVLNCDAGRVVAGNDDEDYYSNLMDPLIYSAFEKNLKNLIVTARMLVDLSSSGSENFTLSLVRQPENAELEPNNLYSSANIVTSDRMEGELSKEKRLILGELVEDQDWFRFDLLRGNVLDLSIKAGNGGKFVSEIWAGSYSDTGTTIIPLRFNMLSGDETHRVNMLMPFSGNAYLILEGTDVPYSIDVSVQDSVESILTFEGRVLETVDTPDCGWRFFEWTMPNMYDFFEISLESSEGKAGMHIFDSRYRPHIFLEPNETNRFFVHRYENTGRLFFGMYFDECEQESDNTMELKILKRKENFFEWDDSGRIFSIKYAGNGSYQGFFNTDELFVENLFDIEIEEDGTLFLQTGPSRDTTAFDIDTVITLFKGYEKVDENDDAISFINYNKYSYLRHSVKKGEHYTVQVMPFMTESSHVPSMNIIGNYILDIIIK